MKRIFKNSLLFLDLPQGDILSAGFTIMLLSMITGIFGIIRNRLLASYFTPDLIGIYLASFVIPDNILQIVVLSAMGTAFIPVFTKYKKLGNQWEATKAIGTTLLFIFLTLIILAYVFTQPLSFLLVGGIQKDHPTHIALLVNLTRIILLGQIFFFFSYIATGILQSYQRFIIPALSPLFYNIGIIIGIVALSPTFGMYGVVIGIIFGAFLHFAIQIPFLLRVGFRIPFGRLRLFHPAVKEVGNLSAPRVLSIGIERVKLTVDTFLSSLVSISSITYLNFAFQVATFPVSLVAAAIAQAALPFFANSVANNNLEEFKNHMRLSLTHIIFLLTPFSVLLAVFHTPIVRLLFGAPLFSWEATILTSRTLAILCVGLIAQGANNILARGFYAFLDTKTPLVMTAISMTISILLSIFFVTQLHLDVRSLAVSTTIGAFVNAVLLFALLDKKVGGLVNGSFLRSIGKIFAISGILGVVSYAMLKMLEVYFNTSYTLQLLLFTALIILLGSLFYLFLSFLFNLEEYKELFLLFKRAARIREKLFERAS